MVEYNIRSNLKIIQKENYLDIKKLKTDKSKNNEKIDKLFLDFEFEDILNSESNFEDNLQILGSGRYSKVYGFNRYALKILNDTTVQYHDLQSEIEVLNCISHQNVLHGYGVFKIDRSICFVMDRKISSLLNYKFNNINDKYIVIQQLQDALLYLHSKMYLHLDISLSNILYDYNSNGQISAYISDFSLSEKTKDLKFSDGHHRISPVYRPYENLRGSTLYTNKSDLWSLGICIYEILNDINFETQITPIFINGKHELEKSVEMQIQKMIIWKTWISNSGNNLLNIDINSRNFQNFKY